MYGPLRDGPSLTPHVLAAMYFLTALPPTPNDAAASFTRGRRYLSSLIDADGRLTEPLRYPVYTAAVASWVVTLDGASPRTQQEHAVWLSLLRSHQLDERLGWPPGDAEYGGFGYSIEPPRKPPPGVPPEPLAGSNLSATVYGLGALRNADVPMTDPAYAKILAFAARCQNFSEDPARADPAYDDGGFHFIPQDAARNKAGVAGTDRHGRTRFHSYGAATADGLRLLLHAGLPPEHPRVQAARRWLERHFEPRHNPGTFQPDREEIRDATYFYYCWSVAHAFLHLNVRRIETRDGPVNWADSLARALIDTQKQDGSWTNVYRDTKEDDPLIATPHAVAALVICRSMITGFDEPSMRLLPRGHRAVSL